MDLRLVPKLLPGGLAGAATLALAACGLAHLVPPHSGSETLVLPQFVKEPSPLTQPTGLRTFASCAEAQAHVAKEANAEVERAFAWQLKWLQDHPGSGIPVSAVGMSDRTYNGRVATAGTAPPPAPVPMPSGNGAAAPAAHTGTNDQVPGVDEADMVKTDGAFIYQLAGRKLAILKAWPAAEMAQVSTLDLGGDPVGLLMGEDHKLLVMTMNSDYASMRADVVDTSAAAAPKITATYELGGTLVAARLSGHTARLIVATPRKAPDGVVWYPDAANFAAWPFARQAAWYAAQTEKNRAIIDATPLSFWLDGSGFAKIGDAGARTPLFDLGDCGGVNAPKNAVTPGVTHIATFDLGSGKVSDAALLAQVARAYATSTTVYLTTPYYWWDDDSADTDYTTIHAFVQDQSGALAYAGSGGVSGSVANQFSMDEQDGYLRVATTVTRREKDASGAWTQWTSASRVSVLAVKDAEASGELSLVGRTPDFSAGELLYGVRFLGKRGYAVTFRRMDPLFVVDLSDPANPRLAGRLEISGYSSYLQPLDDTHLIALGREADPVSGRASVQKLSIFDVTDPLAPKETCRQDLSDGTYTNAEQEHLAFTYLPEKQRLALPFATYRTNEDGSARVVGGVKLYAVSPAAGIKELGGQNAMVVDDAPVERALLADDYVYAVGPLGVRVSALAAPGTILKAVGYPWAASNNQLERFNYRP